MGCGLSTTYETPAEKKARLAREERLRVRRAIRERIMKPLQEFTFGTSESDWEQMDDECRPPLLATGQPDSPSPSEAYVQPPQQTAAQLHDVLTAYTFGSPQEGPFSSPGTGGSLAVHPGGGSQSQPTQGQSTQSSFTQSVNSSSGNGGGGPPRRLSHTSEGDPEPSDVEVTSLLSLTSNSSTSSKVSTKGQVFAHKNSLMHRDLNKNGLNLIGHRESIARFAQHGSEHSSGDFALGLTLSRRQTMDTKEYDAVEKLPSGIRVLDVAALSELEDETADYDDNASENPGYAPSLAQSQLSLGSARSSVSSLHAPHGGWVKASAVPNGHGAAGGHTEVWDEEVPLGGNLDAEEADFMALYMGGGPGGGGPPPPISPYQSNIGAGDSVNTSNTNNTSTSNWSQMAPVSHNKDFLVPGAARSNSSSMNGGNSASIHSQQSLMMSGNVGATPQRMFTSNGNGGSQGGGPRSKYQESNAEAWKAGDEDEIETIAA